MNVDDVVINDTVAANPCPFCGNDDLIVKLIPLLLDGDIIKQYQVLCSMDRSGCGASSGVYWSASEAIEHWNCRKIPVSHDEVEK